MVTYTTSQTPPMQRTQIYLPEALRSQLKVRAQQEAVSVSEIIRRAVEREIQHDPGSEARAYFAQLRPLQSFATAAVGSPESHVRKLRSRSRLLRDS